MQRNKLLLNKYTILFFILSIYAAGDIFLHKGMAAVLFSAAPDVKPVFAGIERCDDSLASNGKRWVKAVNTLAKIEQLQQDIPGFEMDVYFDTVKNCLLLYHDSSEYSTLNIDAVLNKYLQRRMKASIWLDFKNLSVLNEGRALQYIIALRKTYQLQNKLIIESRYPECLQSFCDNGFFTSYYTPFFNPYRESEIVVKKYIDSISAKISRYHVSALSGYYFQYPFLKKYFPGFPVLSWADGSKFSIVCYLFNSKLLADGRLKVVLYPEY